MLSTFLTKPVKFDRVSYGMLIDSDFDNNTGYRGIDYDLRVSSVNTMQWTKVWS